MYAHDLRRQAAIARGLMYIRMCWRTATSRRLSDRERSSSNLIFDAAHRMTDPALLGRCLSERCLSLDKKCTKDRAVALSLVLAIATQGEIGLVRQRCQ